MTVTFSSAYIVYAIFTLNATKVDSRVHTWSASSISQCMQYIIGRFLKSTYSASTRKINFSALWLRNKKHVPCFYWVIETRNTKLLWVFL